MTIPINPRIAQRRRQVREEHAHTALKRLLIVLLIGGLAALGFWLTRSSFLSVATIKVQGVQNSDTASLLAAASVEMGRPLISIDPAVVEATLLTDPWIETVRVHRVWPQTINVTVSERWPIATLARENEQLVLVSEDSTELVAVSDPDPMLPIIVSNRVDSVEAALLFVNSLPPDLGASTVLRVADTLHATVAGYSIRLGGGDDMVAKANALLGILETGPPPGSVITVIAPTRPAVLSPEPAADSSTIDDEDLSESEPPTANT